MTEQSMNLRFYTKMDQPKITVKYGCDRCGRLYDTNEGMVVVEIRFIRTVNGYLTYDSRHELICQMCESERTVDDS